MAFLERDFARPDDIGDGAAFRLIVEIGGAVVDAQIRLADAAGEFLGRDQPATFRHVSLP